MAFQFKFRKFIGDTPVPSAIPSLDSNWNGAIVLSAQTTNEEYQSYFTREWVEDDGIEVYKPESKKHKAGKNDIEFLLYGVDATVRQSFNTIIKTLNDWGVFEYYDNYNKGLKRLIYDSFTVIKEIERNGNRVIHFKISCTNILGYDIKNFNPTNGTTLW